MTARASGPNNVTRRPRHPGRSLGPDPAVPVTRDESRRRRPGRGPAGVDSEPVRVTGIVGRPRRRQPGHGSSAGTGCPGLSHALSEYYVTGPPHGDRRYGPRISARQSQCRGPRHDWPRPPGRWRQPVTVTVRVAVTTAGPGSGCGTVQIRPAAAARRLRPGAAVNESDAAGYEARSPAATRLP